jgi:hypothetical protein
MIAYRISLADLERRIAAHNPTWLARALARTARFRDAGSYEEEKSIWSDVKPVYMALQGNAKCAFCERKLEPPKFGLAEQAVEHFRPKGNLRDWRLPPEFKPDGIKLGRKSTKKGGYYLLAYHPFNYSAACHPCNSVIKSDFFPVAGSHQLTGDDPQKLHAGEKPLLIYPIGDFDEDPETLLRFRGVSPYAVHASGHRRHRAMVTISFFHLDDPERGLPQERNRVIVAMFPALVTIAGKGSQARKKLAKSIVAGFTAETAPHANCARSFRLLFEQDPREAERIFNAAADCIAAKS